MTLQPQIFVDFVTIDSTFLLNLKSLICNLVQQIGEETGVQNTYHTALEVRIEIDFLAEQYDNQEGIPNCRSEMMTYDKCVDEKIKADLLPKKGCIPPWLSPDNHCDNIYDNKTFHNSVLDWKFYSDYIAPYSYFGQNPAEKACSRNECKQTRYHVQRRGRTKNGNLSKKSVAKILINPKVRMSSHFFSKLHSDLIDRLCFKSNWLLLLISPNLWSTKSFLGLV